MLILKLSMEECHAKYLDTFSIGSVSRYILRRVCEIYPIRCIIHSTGLNVYVCMQETGRCWGRRCINSTARLSSPLAVRPSIHAACLSACTLQAVVVTFDIYRTDARSVPSERSISFLCAPRAAPRLNAAVPPSSSTATVWHSAWGIVCMRHATTFANAFRFDFASGRTWKWRTWNWRTRYISFENRLHYNAVCNSFQNNGRIQVTAAQ